MGTTPTNDNTSSIIDVLSRMSGMGSLSSSYAEMLSGFNHRGVGVPFPTHAESTGITFFTRPNLNLAYDNLAVDRILTPLMTDNPLTLQRVIRAMLDPVGAGLNLYYSTGRNINTPLFDSKSAFMPLLSNTLLSLSGWPDIAMDTYTSHEGVMRENWSMADGTSKTYTTVDLSATFRNVGGDPITLLLMVWVTYMDRIHRGDMVPYFQSIMTNRVDYHTRIFRFTLDPSRTRIQKWSSATGCFPVGVPIGAAMNYTSDNAYTQENSDAISTSFRAQIVEYMDPILLNEFNETVVLFNPEMADDVRESYYTKVPYQYLNYFNRSIGSYPRINVLTNELEWWIDSTIYNQDVANITSVSTVPEVPIPYSTLSQPIMASNATTAAASTATPAPISAGYGWSNFLADAAGNLSAVPTDASDTGSSNLS